MKGVTRQTGIISDIDEAVVRVRVTLPECDNLRSNWLAVLQRNTQDNKDYWLPDIGEQVEVSLDDNGEDGVVLGAVYSSVDTAPLASRDKRYVQFSDGAAFEYDRALHQLTVNGGIEKIVIEVKEHTQLTSPQVEVRAQHRRCAAQHLYRRRYRDEKTHLAWRYGRQRRRRKQRGDYGQRECPRQRALSSLQKVHKHRPGKRRSATGQIAGGYLFSAQRD